MDHGSYSSNLQDIANCRLLLLHKQLTSLRHYVAACKRTAYYLWVQVTDGKPLIFEQEREKISTWVSSTAHSHNMWKKRRSVCEYMRRTVGQHVAATGSVFSVAGGGQYTNERAGQLFSSYLFFKHIGRESILMRAPTTKLCIKSEPAVGECYKK